MIDVNLLKNSVGIDRHEAVIFREGVYDLDELSQELESNGIAADKGLLGPDSERECGFTISTNRAIFAPTETFIRLKYVIKDLDYFVIQEGDIEESAADIERYLL